MKKIIARSLWVTAGLVMGTAVMLTDPGVNLVISGGIALQCVFMALQIEGIK